MRKKTIKCIVVPRGIVNEIMAEVGCSQMSVYRAFVKNFFGYWQDFL